MAQYATTIIFEAGSTTTVTSFNISGQAGQLVTLRSSVPGTQYTLSKSSGTVTASYASIEDSNATGGAYWDATDGTNINAGNNDGWNFPILPVTGQFMTFF
jgi:hypothetical protein